MLKTIRVLLYIVSAIFLYFGTFALYMEFSLPPEAAANLGEVPAADMKTVTSTAKVAVAILFFILAAIPLLIAFATKRFRNWKAPLGNILVTIAAIHAFSLISFLCIQASGVVPPELLQKQAALLQNLFSVVATIFGIGAIGVLLIRAESQTDA